jgi:hypothetical protein
LSPEQCHVRNGSTQKKTNKKKQKNNQHKSNTLKKAHTKTNKQTNKQTMCHPPGLRRGAARRGHELRAAVPAAGVSARAPSGRGRGPAARTRGLDVPPRAADSLGLAATAADTGTAPGSRGPQGLEMITKLGGHSLESVFFFFFFSLSRLASRLLFF